MQSASASPVPSGELDDVSRGDAAINSLGDGSNLIEMSPLVDIAFLHSIATHRPIGPHKHFNIIPILVNLDRTARQIGARIRDDGYVEEAAGAGEEEQPREERAGEVELNGGESSGGRIKREEGEDFSSFAYEQSYPSSRSTTVPPVDSQMVWQRLNQLYDVGGLEELECQAVDNDVDSPFRITPSVHRRRSGRGDQRPTIPFGFGSGLEKRRSKQSRAGRGNSKKATNTAAGGEEEADDESAGVAQGREFELGPWEEFEEFVAPRRLKSYAPDEEGQQSESDGELSEPSEGEGAEDEAAGEDEEGEEEGREEEEEEGEEEEASEEDDGGGEEGEEDDEDDASTKAKRKATTGAKRGSHSKRSKQVAATNAAAAATASSSSSRGTRNSTKPRRSSRR